MGAKGTHNGRKRSELIQIDLLKKTREQMQMIKKSSRGMLKNYDDVWNYLMSNNEKYFKLKSKR